MAKVRIRVRHCQGLCLSGALVAETYFNYLGSNSHHVRGGRSVDGRLMPFNQISL